MPVLPCSIAEVQRHSASSLQPPYATQMAQSLKYKETVSKMSGAMVPDSVPLKYATIWKKQTNKNKKTKQQQPPPKKWYATILQKICSLKMLLNSHLDVTAFNWCQWHQLKKVWLVEK